jgi:hypothetical protein
VDWSGNRASGACHAWKVTSCFVEQPWCYSYKNEIYLKSRRNISA